jgi:hypothetical protein
MKAGPDRGESSTGHDVTQTARNAFGCGVPKGPRTIEAMILPPTRPSPMARAVAAEAY